MSILSILETATTVFTMQAKDILGKPPGIIKYPFWRMTAENPKAVYACVNLGEVWAPGEIADRAICMEGDIGEVLKN